MDWLSLLLPFIYITILFGSLYTFSYLYRRRQSQKALSLTPWFAPHLPRQIYLSLLELQSSPTTKVPDSVLRAALLRRATADIHRLLSLRTSKPALSQLLARGSVGDDLWQRFQIAEKEMEIELREVVEEANALSAGWGSVIFQSASEAAHNEMVRRKLKEIEELRGEEKQGWERQRESVREGFMKELEGGDGDVGGSGKEVREEKIVEDVPAVEEPKEKTIKTGSSDEDTVMVEKEALEQEASTPSGGKKKKKGKK